MIVREWGSGAGEYRVFFGLMKMFWNQRDVVVAQHCKCAKCHQNVHFKMIKFMLVSVSSIKKKNKPTVGLGEV